VASVAKPVSYGDELTPASGSFITGRVRASPSSGTLRYRVARLTPRTWATSVTGVFSLIIFRACFNFAGLNALGRPPRRPRSRAHRGPDAPRTICRPPTRDKGHDHCVLVARHARHARPTIYDNLAPAAGSCWCGSWGVSPAGTTMLCIILSAKVCRLGRSHKGNSQPR